jgi:hypothetical protein
MVLNVSLFLINHRFSPLTDTKIGNLYYKSNTKTKKENFLRFFKDPLQ